MRSLTPTILEFERAKGVWCYQVNAFRDVKSWGAGLDNKAADALGAATVISAREHRIKISDTRVGYPGLAAVQHPMVTILRRATFHRGHI